MFTSFDNKPEIKVYINNITLFKTKAKRNNHFRTLIAQYTSKHEKYVYKAEIEQRIGFNLLQKNWSFLKYRLVKITLSYITLI